MIHIIFIVLKMLSCTSEPCVDGDTAILQETINIRIEMFHHSISQNNLALFRSDLLPPEGFTVHNKA